MEKEVKCFIKASRELGAAVNTELVRPGQVNSQFIVTARMLLNTPAWNFIINISDRNTLIERSLCSNRAISCAMKYEK